MKIIDIILRRKPCEWCGKHINVNSMFLLIGYTKKDLLVCSKCKDVVINLEQRDLSDADVLSQISEHIKEDLRSAKLMFRVERVIDKKDANKPNILDVEK